MTGFYNEKKSAPTFVGAGGLCGIDRVDLYSRKAWGFGVAVAAGGKLHHRPYGNWRGGQVQRRPLLERVFGAGTAGDTVRPDLFRMHTVTAQDDGVLTAPIITHRAPWRIALAA